MESLCGVFETFDAKKERLIQAGYVKYGDNRLYNREAVKEQLLDLCEGKQLERNPLLWWEKDGEEETLFLTYPVMMSLILEEYDCTKKLLELGYVADTNTFQTQIYATNVDKYDGELKCQELLLQQLLLAREVPVDVLEEVLSKAEQEENIFNFERDYWLNPLLVAEPNVVVRKGIPSLQGVKHLYHHFPDKMKGFVGESRNHRSDRWRQDIKKLDAKTRHQLLEMLLVLSKGNALALNVVFETFRPTFYYDKFDNGQREMDYWLKNLLNFYKACEGNEECEGLYFEMLVTLLYEMIDYGCKCEKGKHKERYEKLKEAIVAGKPAYYTAENYLLYVYENMRNIVRQQQKMNWTKYLEIWKHVVKEPLLIARNSEALWMFLRYWFKITDENFDSDFFDEEDETEEEIEEKLMTYIFFLEEIDTKIAEDEKEDEYKDLLVEVLFGLMILESEELILACLKNKLIPKEQIKVCINMALRFGKLRLVPPLIMAQ